MDNNHETMNMEDVERHIEEHGLSGIEVFIKSKLERWKDVVINIGITGGSGVGKSSFINAIRGIADDDELAAETEVRQCTKNATDYRHPTNDKIIFWDLPAFGTPNCPDLETYSEKVGLEKYDTFLIFTASRFTKIGLDLAKNVKTMKKSLFFIRTKIDQDYAIHARRKRGLNEKEMLKKIRDDCLENLEGMHDKKKKDEVVFLISNHHPTKWDFARLTQAILDVPPLRQKQSLTLSLGVLSSDLLKRKVKILRDRIWKVALGSAAGAAVPLPGLSVAVDLALIAKELSFYKTQLGFPDENDYEFQQMTPENQDIVRKFFFTSTTQLATLVATYAACSAVARFVPFVGWFIAGGISYSATKHFLNKCLNELESTALSCLDELTRKAVDDFDIDSWRSGSSTALSCLDELTRKAVDDFDIDSWRSGSKDMLKRKAENPRGPVED